MDKVKGKIICKIAVVIVIIIALVFIFKSGKGIKQFSDLDSLIVFIKERGKYAILVFLLIFALKPLVMVIPSTIMTITAGILFGPFYGFILSLTGIFISGTLAFALSRFLGKDFVNRILKGKVVSLNKNLNENGFKVLLLLRLPPVLPYDPVSYACGLSEIKYFDFITASVIGVMPETFCYSVIGENFRNPMSVKFLVPLILIIVATVLSGVIFKKSGKKN